MRDEKEHFVQILLTVLDSVTEKIIKFIKINTLQYMIFDRVLEN